MTECSFKKCTDDATVIVDKDGELYCRGHGLSEASKRPACGITSVPKVGDLARTHGVGRCVGCGSVVRWARLNDGDELVALEWGALRRVAVVGDVAYNPASQGAVPVAGENLNQVRAWAHAGRVHVYKPHEVACPARDSEPTKEADRG